MPLKSHLENSIKKPQRALIIGAGGAGEMLANKARANSNSQICPIGGPLPNRKIAAGSTARADLDHQVKLLIEAARVSDRNLVFEYLKQIVPEYKTVGDRHGSTADAQGSS